MNSSYVLFASREKLRASSTTSFSTDSEEAFHDDQTVRDSVDSCQHFRRKPHRNQMCQYLIYALAAWGFTSLCHLAYQAASNGSPTPPASGLSKDVDVYRPSTFPDPDLNLCDCGTTTTTAISRGCIYDSLAAAWLPPHCRDDILTNEFDRSGPGPGGAWPYFADANGTTPLNKSEVAALGDGERAFWSTRDWHLAHCMFYWEKMVRMRETGVVMERRFDRVAHARHCRRLAMKRNPDHELLIEVGVVMNSRIVRPGPT